MHNIEARRTPWQTITAGAAALAIGFGIVTVPTIAAAPAPDPAVVEVVQDDGSVEAVPAVEVRPGAAHAATWLPQRPKTRQPVGWGGTCAIVTTRHWWAGSYTTEYRWFTTSIGAVTGHSTCKAYRTW